MDAPPSSKDAIDLGYMTPEELAKEELHREGHFANMREPGLRPVSWVLIAIFVVIIAFVTYKSIKARNNLKVWANHGFSLKNLKFKYVKLANLICGLYALTVTFVKFNKLGIFGGVRNPYTGWIQSPEEEFGDEWAVQGLYKYHSFIKPDQLVVRSVVALNVDQMVLLGISRFSGFSMYPVLVLVMFTKCRATQAFFDKTPLSVFFIQDTHALHVFSGWYILVDCSIHTFCHCLRWIDQGNIHLLWSSPHGCNPSGISGLVVILSTFIIVFPMTFFKKYIKFEMRKYAHYFFWIFLIAMTVHAPFWALPNAGYCHIIFPILIIWYGLDATYVKFFMSERINTVSYRVVDSGVELSMPVSDRFRKNLNSGGYGYVMAPWVDKKQWHAFSIYENPLDPSIRQMFMAKVGDWTKALHDKVDNSNDSARPLWLCGPFPSPYNNAQDFDNMICVASGVGITPALSAIESYRETRRCNLIWAVRDPSMLVFFLENAKLCDNAMNLVFYTGKDPLPDVIENYNLSHTAHLEIVKSRANIGRLIPNIINYFENPDSDYTRCELWKTQNDNDLSSVDSSDMAHGIGDPEQGYRFSNVSGLPMDSKSIEMRQILKEDGDNDNIKTSERSKGGEVFGADDRFSNVSGLPMNSKSLEMRRISEADGGKDNIKTSERSKGGVTFGEGFESFHTKSGNSSELSLGSHSEELNDDPEPTPLKMRKSKFRKNSSVYGLQNQLLRDKLIHKSSDIHKSGGGRMKGRLTITTNGKKSEKSGLGYPEVWEEDKDARTYVESKIPQTRLETWGLLYCGGRNPLLHNLVQTSKDLKIPLHEEAFDW